MTKIFVYVAIALFAISLEVAVSSNEMVAFLCNRPSMFKTSAGWVKDDSTDCLRSPEDILDYCRKVYPDLDVRNIVEANKKAEIHNWCDFGVTYCEHKFTVRPYHCLVGPFQSDALLVPEHCVFDHVHNSRLCSSYSHWNRTARQSCTARGYQLQNFAILQPCGIDKFNGVEFVCCPRDKANETTQPAVTEAPKTNSPPTAATSPHQVRVADDEQRDVYQENRGDRWNEHEYFVKARSDLQKHHHEKIAKMMKDWSAARQRVQEVKAKNTKEGEKMSKEITGRFQKLYEVAEREASVEKRQLTLLHQQRVQAEMDDRKRRLLQKYVEAVDVDEQHIDATRILRTLIRYVKALQKDRIHIMNRYRHQLQSSPEDAESNRPQMVDHLANSDRQLTASIHMLDHLGHYKDKILKQIEEYLRAYHAVDANILALFGPLETTTTSTSTTTTTTTTTAPTTTKLIDAILADEDGYDDYMDYYDDYLYFEPSEPLNWEEQQFKNAMEDKKIFDEDYDSDDSVDDDDDEDEEDDLDYYDYEDYNYEDEHPSSDTQASSADDTATDDQDEADNDKDDDDTMSHTDYQHDANDNSDAFDYVRVQLPMGGHGDNIAKSQLTANQPYLQKSALKQGAETFSAVPLGIAVGCITVFVVIVAGIVVMRRRGASRRYGQRRGAGAPARLPLDPAASPEERHVAAMQMTGYENPTYKYFESSAASA